MGQPARIQRKRAKGWRMPEGAVYVGRGSKYGNPHVVGSRSEGILIKDRTQAMTMFEYIYKNKIWADYGLPSPEEIQSGLKGRDLACWCPEDDDCHVEVLLIIANS